MLILEKIQQDLKHSVKTADTVRVGVLRLVLSALHNEEIGKRTRGQEIILTEEEVIGILKKEAKKRKEAIEIYSRVNRRDLWQKEEKELAIIEEYLPAVADQTVIEAAVKKVIDSGLKDFGLIMKEAMKELAGRAEGKEVAEAAKKFLAKNG